ncbi:hypothetical protein NN561_017656 [Cricetulus griseus]
MDQCVTVERELEKVLHKFSGYGQLCERGLEELIDYTGGLKHEILQSHGEGDRSGVGARRCVCWFPRPRRLSLLSRTHPETRWPRGAVRCTRRGARVLGGRAGRRCASDEEAIFVILSDLPHCGVFVLLQKNFDSDISSVGIDGCWQADSQRLLNEVMVEHFFRQGMLDVAEELCQESGLSVDPSQKEPFVELNRILEALKVRVLRPALEWAVSNREMLIAQNSSLEFKLHRLYFISLLMGGTTNQREALQYAKNFQPFALNHQKDIQVLMGSLVYLRQGIENSPYVHLLDANQWADICDIFTRDACALLGLSVESPLSVRLKWTLVRSAGITPYLPAPFFVSKQQITIHP